MLEFLDPNRLCQILEVRPNYTWTETDPEWCYRYDDAYVQILQIREGVVHQLADDFATRVWFPVGMCRAIAVANLNYAGCKVAFEDGTEWLVFNRLGSQRLMGEPVQLKGPADLSEYLKPSHYFWTRFLKNRGDLD